MTLQQNPLLFFTSFPLFLSIAMGHLTFADRKLEFTFTIKE